MAITPSDFSKIWASNADTPEYTFSDANYQKGWDFVGNLPPTRAMWNAMQKSTDEKMKYVFDNFGAPLTASTVAEMTMQNRIYVYTGSETGYTAGHWYYWNGSAWTDGGVYNAVAVVTDTTLTQAGVPADAKATGDALSLKADASTVPVVDSTLTISGAAADAKATGDKINDTTTTITGKMKLIEPYNLWNPDHVQSGYITLNGGIYSSSSYMYNTDYIPVSQGDVIRRYYVSTTILLGNMRYVTAYDSNHNAIESAGGDNVAQYTVPAGVAYVRITSFVSTAQMIVTKNKTVTSILSYFDPYYMADEGFADIDIDAESNFDSQYLDWSGVNRLNPDECEIGKYIGENGIINVNPSYYLSGKIPIFPGETLYIISNNPIVVSASYRFYTIYDRNNDIIGSGSNTNQISYIEGAKYVRFSALYRSTESAQQPTGNMVISDNSVSTFIAYGTKPKIKSEYIPSVQDTTVPLVYLPSEICVGVGRTIELYNELVCQNASKYHLHYTCNVGTQYERKYTIVGVQNKIGSYGLTLDVYDDNMKRVWTGTSTVKVVANNIANTLNVLPIGDSLTNRKPWLLEVQNLSNNKIHFIGTRGLSTDPFHQEGRSGFTAADYNSSRSYSYDNNYVGNPDFSATANPFWDTDNNKFSLSYWITNQASTVGTPDVIQLFLGTNGLSINPETTVNAIVAMIDSIQDEYPNIPIFVCNTIYHSNQNGYYSSGGDGYVGSVGDWAYNNDLKIMNLQLALREALSGYSNVYFAPLSVCMDRENDFGRVEVPVNPRLTTVTETIPVEYTHPQTPGYYQIADVLYSCYCAHLS